MVVKITMTVLTMGNYANIHCKNCFKPQTSFRSRILNFISILIDSSHRTREFWLFALVWSDKSCTKWKSLEKSFRNTFHLSSTLDDRALPGGARYNLSCRREINFTSYLSITILTATFSDKKKKGNSSF